MLLVSVRPLFYFGFFTAPEIEKAVCNMAVSRCLMLVLHQTCPKSHPGDNHDPREDFMWPPASIIKCIVHGQPGLG